MADILEERPIRKFLKRLSHHSYVKHSPQEFTLSQIDMAIRDIQEFIEDEVKATRSYITESKNPMIQAINGSGILLAISEDEKRHAQQLATLLPKLKEKWEEVCRKLV